MLSAKARRMRRYDERRAALDEAARIRARLMRDGKTCAICRHYNGVNVECVPLEMPPHENHICAEFEDR